jgi:hypothetical protein
MRHKYNEYKKIRSSYWVVGSAYLLCFIHINNQSLKVILEKILYCLLVEIIIGRDAQRGCWGGVGVAPLENLVGKKSQGII